MTKTLKELQEEHPDIDFHMYEGNAAFDLLIAAKREDEARIMELTSPCNCTDHEVCDKCQLARRQVPILQSQLTAERLSHEETRQQLVEADYGHAYFASSHGVFHTVPEIERAYDARRAALGRRASITRPTDDPNSYLDKCPQCGGEADNGHDRCLPPNPYLCSKCTDDRGEGEK